MSTFIPVNFDDAVEPQPLPVGRYPVQITEAKLGESGPNAKNPGAPQLIVTIGFTGNTREEQNAPTIRHYISLPSEMDDPKSANFKALLLKRFLVAFNVPFQANGIDTDQIIFDMVGREANLEVELQEPDSNGNVYNRVRIPRIPGEKR